MQVREQRERGQRKEPEGPEQQPERGGHPGGPVAAARAQADAGAPRWQRTLYVMAASQVITQTAFTLGLPFLPLYIQTLGVRDPETAALWAGVSATASGLAMAVISPVWGRAADRFGAKAMVLRATFTGVFIVGAMGLAGGPGLLVALRLIQGLLTGTVSAANTLVAGVVPPRRLGSAMGLMQTAVFAGAAGGPLIGGVLADRFGYRVPFAGTALLLLVAGLLVVFGARELRVRPVPGAGLPTTQDAPSGLTAGEALAVEVGAGTGEAGAGEPDAGRPASGRRARPTRGHTRLVLAAILPIVVVNFLDQMAGSIVGPVLPLVIKDLAGPAVSNVASLTGVILGAVAVSASVGALLAGRLSDRFSAARVLAVSAGVAAVFAALQGLALNVELLGIFRVLMGLFIGGTIPAASAIMGTLIRPQDRGVAFGLTASASSAGFAAGPLLGALLLHLNIRAPFYLTALLMGAECLWVLRTLGVGSRK